MLHGLPDMTLHSTHHNVILYGLWEDTSERQVILHGSFVLSMVLMVKSGRKCITNIYYIIKQLLTYALGRHGVLLNNKLFILTSAPRRSI